MKHFNYFKTGFMALFVLFALNSCRNPKLDKDGKKQQLDSTETADAGLSDAQIASIAVTANKVDISYAEIAEEKAQDEQVKDFAQTMAKDHQTVIDKAMSLAQKLDVTPEDNNITRKLLDMEKDIKEKLNGLSDGEFDKAYINNEVTYHKMAID